MSEQAFQARVTEQKTGLAAPLDFKDWLSDRTQVLTGRFDQVAAQIQAGPYSLMPTNLNSWSALGFFTNAGELLLRSQTFIFTNYATNAAGQFIVSTNYFGLTNIPVCMTNNRGIVSYLYNEQIHRMLQLAANIYDATTNNNSSTSCANTSHGRICCSIMLKRAFSIFICSL